MKSNIVRTVLMSCMLAGLGVGETAQAHDYYAKHFHIFHPWADPTEPGVADTSVYVKFDNISADDQLIGAKTILAERVELRAATDPAIAGDDGLLLPHIQLAAGEEVELRPGAVRMVLKGLLLPLQWGRSYPMTLEFEKSGVLFVMVSVGTP